MTSLSLSIPIMASTRATVGNLKSSDFPASTAHLAAPAPATCARPKLRVGHFQNSHRGCQPSFLHGFAARLDLSCCPQMPMLGSRWWLFQSWWAFVMACQGLWPFRSWRRAPFPWGHVNKARATLCVSNEERTLLGYLLLTMMMLAVSGFGVMDWLRQERLVFWGRNKGLMFKVL